MANTSILAAFERMWQHIVNALSNKADKVHNHDDAYYTESEVDTKILDINTSVSNIYETKTDAAVKLDEAKAYADSISHKHNNKDELDKITAGKVASWDGKADRASTLEGYGITDAASKTYVDTLIEGLTTEGTADAALVQAALTAHTNDKANPHGVTLEQLGVTSTSVELSYVSGVSSNIQNQLDSKANSEHTHDDYLIASDIANKVDKSYFNEQLSTKADNSHTHEEYLESKDIVSKADKSYVDDELTKKANVAHTHEQYLEVEDINGLASEEFVTTKIAEAKLAASDVDLSSYYTKSETDAKIDEAIDAIEHPTIDLTPYATTSYVDKQLVTKADAEHSHKQYLIADDIANKADKSELHEHDNKSVLDEISEEKVLSWDNKSDFSGSYNDLTDTPNVLDDKSAEFNIADENENVIFKVDVNGVHTTSIETDFLVLNGVDIGTKLNNKADKATTLEGYGITDAASKEYVDTIIEGLTTEGTADAALVQAALTAHTNDKANPHGVSLSQLGVTSTATELNYVSGVTSNIQNQLSNKAASSHTHSASDINSGVLPLNRGGTGTSVDLNNAPPRSIIVKAGTGYDQLYYTPTKNGAFYATEENGSAKFGTLPLAQGGTGSSVDLDAAPANAIIRKLSSDKYNQLYYTATKNGAFYATEENGVPAFGTLPIAQGGTGATTAEEALSALAYHTVTTTGTSLDDYIEPGVYYFANNYTPTNIPVGVNGWLMVIPYSTSLIKQLWFRHGTNNTNDFHTYVRTCSGGAWSTWRRFFTDADTIAVANGGTGATTAIDALDNLGALNLKCVTDNAHQIVNNDDLNNFTNVGVYRCHTAAIAKSLSNAPLYQGSGFNLIVQDTSTAVGKLQIAIFNSAVVRIWMRVYTSNNEWGEWSQLLTNVLSVTDYGTSLPTAGTAGRIFFKKVSN